MSTGTDGHALCAIERKKGRHRKEIGSLWTYLGGGIVQHGRDDALLEGGQRLGDLFLLGRGREAKRGGRYMRDVKNMNAWRSKIKVHSGDYGTRGG